MLRSQSYFPTSGIQCDDRFDPVVVDCSDPTPAAFVRQDEITHLHLLNRNITAPSCDQFTLCHTGVVDQQTVRPFAGDPPTHARCHIPASVALDCPLLGCLKIRVQSSVKDRLVDRVVDDLLDFPAERHRQRHVIRTGDELMIRASPQVPRREHPGSNLGLTVAWRHQQHQPRAFTLLHLTAETLQAAANVLMHPPCLVAGVDLLDERQQTATGKDAMRKFTPGCVMWRRLGTDPTMHRRHRGHIR